MGDERGQLDCAWLWQYLDVREKTEKRGRQKILETLKIMSITHAYMIDGGSLRTKSACPFHGLNVILVREKSKANGAGGMAQSQGLGE